MSSFRQEEPVSGPVLSQQDEWPCSSHRTPSFVAAVVAAAAFLFYERHQSSHTAFCMRNVFTKFMFCCNTWSCRVDLSCCEFTDKHATHSNLVKIKYARGKVAQGRVARERVPWGRVSPGRVFRGRVPWVCSPVKPGKSLAWHWCPRAASQNLVCAQASFSTVNCCRQEWFYF